jgi:hypothetical protein
MIPPPCIARNNLSPGKINGCVKREMITDLLIIKKLVMVLLKVVRFILIRFTGFSVPAELAVLLFERSCCRMPFHQAGSPFLPEKILRRKEDCLLM